MGNILEGEGEGQGQGRGLGQSARTTSGVTLQDAGLPSRGAGGGARARGGAGGGGGAGGSGGAAGGAGGAGGGGAAAAAAAPAPAAGGKATTTARQGGGPQGQSNAATQPQILVEEVAATTRSLGQEEVEEEEAEEAAGTLGRPSPGQLGLQTQPEPEPRAHSQRPPQQVSHMPLAGESVPVPVEDDEAGDVLVQELEHDEHPSVLRTPTTKKVTTSTASSTSTGMTSTSSSATTTRAATSPRTQSPKREPTIDPASPPTRRLKPRYSNSTSSINTLGTSASANNIPGGGPSLRDFAVLKVLGRGSHGALLSFARPPLNVLERAQTCNPTLTPHKAQFKNNNNTGKVYLVRHRDSGNHMAMKTLKKRDVKRRDQVQNTLTELSIHTRLAKQGNKCPYIVPMRYAFQSRSRLFMVFDFCSGGELYHHLGTRGRIPEPLARVYAAEIVLAVGYLHALGIVYRDLKPENLVLDEDGHIHLVDFGLCQEGVSSATSGSTTFCGTTEYLAPEILRYAGHGFAVDWWSFGMVLYEMLTGLPPWYSYDQDRVVEGILGGELVFPDPPSDGNLPAMSAEARDIITRLLTRDPRARLGSQGAKEVMAHPFFATIDWIKLAKKGVEPGFVPPKPEGEDQLCINFDRAFTDLRVTLGQQHNGVEGNNSNGNNSHAAPYPLRTTSPIPPFASPSPRNAGGLTSPRNSGLGTGGGGGGGGGGSGEMLQYPFESAMSPRPALRDPDFGEFVFDAGLVASAATLPQPSSLIRRKSLAGRESVSSMTSAPAHRTASPESSVLRAGDDMVDVRSHSSGSDSSVSDA